MNSVKVAAGDGLGLLRAAVRRLRGTRSATQQFESDIACINASGMFDRDWYLDRYPDVAASAVDPVMHYVLHGAGEDRNPCALFDTKYYKHSNPDVAASGINPFRHFCEFGWREGRNPSEGFDLRRYAAKAGLPADVNPLLHRMQNPGQAGSRRSDAEVFGMPGLFDAAFYLMRNPDVAQSGADPFDHFVRHGSAEGRDPCAMFDSKYYLKSNPDVARARMAPFRHFCMYGWRELRDPSPSFDIARYWLEHMLLSGAKGNPLAHFNTVGRADSLRPVPVGATTSPEWALLAEHAEGALAAGEHDPDTLEMLGQVFADHSNWSAAESAFRSALAGRWDSAKLHNRLAEALEKQGKWWQAAESLERATARDGRHPGWFQRLGDAHEKMNRLEPAIEAFQRALALSPEVSSYHYQLGFALERLGREPEAEATYNRAIELDGRADVARFGVGYLHQKRGYWPEAAAAYARAAERSPLDGALHHRLGMALDRCYRWAEAQQAYEKAIGLSPGTAYWHYRLGFVLERQEQWDAAAEAYAAGVLLSDKFVPYWSYRQGYVLQKAGRYEDACAAYLALQKNQTVYGCQIVPCSGDQGRPLVPQERLLAHERYLARFAQPAVAEQALAQNFLDEALHYDLGRQLELVSDWEAAADAYANAVARADKLMPAWYYRLGAVLYRAGRYQQACEAFASTRSLGAAYGVTLDALKDTERSLAEYVEYSRRPIMQHVVLYESYQGAAIGGNPYAIFLQLLDRKDFKDWTHVWAVADRARIPAWLCTHRNVIVITRQSDAYRRYLAQASHLVNDVTFPYWFIRRSEQKYLNTWHGTPLKGVGKDVPSEFMAHKNVARNFLHATHIISPNAHTSRALTVCQDTHDISIAKLAEVGSPRVDRMLGMSDDEKRMLRLRLGLGKSRPVVLYAPTWRGLHGSAEMDVERLVRDLAALAACDCQLIFRGHQMLEEQISILDLPVAIAPQHIDTSDILAITDILITDYSSIFFDFLPLNRPILFYVYDLQDYEKTRGLYFDMQQMPGRVCRSVAELVEALSSQIRNPHLDEASYVRARQKFCPMEDGQATNRAIAFFFNEDDRWSVPGASNDRLSMLFFAGVFPSNGITASFINLIDGLEAEGRIEASVVIDCDRITQDQQRVDNLTELPRSVRLIARTGRMLFSPEELWIDRVLAVRRDLYTSEMWRILEAAYKREYRRIFGDASFDVIVNFEGYSLFWTKVLAFPPPGTKNLVYMHSDMMSECKVRHPYLQQMFRIYSNYDLLVSVSEKMCEVNANKLSSAFGTDRDKFVWCPNVVDVAHIVRCADEPLDADLAAWAGDRKVFMALGRLSPEKDHAKLIRAFSAVHEKNPDARLLIIGDGPLRHELEIQIEDAKLNDFVLLAGQRRNPFPAMRRCDCFVMPSNHEGQPMVLLEAMVLGKQIVATDIDGNRGVLEGGYGRVVENTVNGLRAGMEEFLRPGLMQTPFDAEKYEEGALAAFHRVAEGQTPSARRDH